METRAVVMQPGSEGEDLDVRITVREAGQVVRVMGCDQAATQANGGCHDEGVHCVSGVFGER